MHGWSLAEQVRWGHGRLSVGCGSSGTPPQEQLGVNAACADALGHIRLFEPSPRPALELVRRVLAPTAEGVKGERDDFHRRDQRHAAVVSRRLALGAFPALGWLERSIGLRIDAQQLANRALRRPCRERVRHHHVVVDHGLARAVRGTDVSALPPVGAVLRHALFVERSPAGFPDHG